MHKSGGTTAIPKTRGVPPQNSTQSLCARVFDRCVCFLLLDSLNFFIEDGHLSRKIYEGRNYEKFIRTSFEWESNKILGIWEVANCFMKIQKVDLKKICCQIKSTCSIKILHLGHKNGKEPMTYIMIIYMIILFFHLLPTLCHCGNMALQNFAPGVPLPARKETSTWVASWDSMVIPNMMNLQPFSPNQEWLNQFWSFLSFCKQTTNLWPCIWSLTCFSSSGRFVNEAQNFQKYRRRSMWH